MSAIFLDEKVGDHMCGICKKRKAKRRLTFSLDGNHLTYMCDLCFDDMRTFMTRTFWVGSRKTRAELEKENPIVLSRGS